MTASFSFTKVLTNSLSVAPQKDSVVRTPMGDGYSKQFQRFSQNFINYDMEYLMTSAQYITFAGTWWKANAAVFFDFVDPIDGSTYQGRIVSGEFSAAPYSLKQTHFSVKMTIERIL